MIEIRLPANVGSLYILPQMMQKISIAIVLLMFQLSVDAQPIRPDHVIDRNSGGFIELKPKEESVESLYLNDNWAIGSLLFQSGYLAEKVSMKYDLKNNVLEIKTQQEIKVADPSRFTSFTLFEGDNRRLFLGNAGRVVKEYPGLLEVLVEGGMMLYAQPYLDVRPANYNPALNIGSRTDQYTVTERLLLVHNGKATDITKMGRKMLPLFGVQSEQVKRFVEENRLSWKEKSDLVKIVEHYNSVINSGN